ncbi:MAG: MFS transporter [Alphaproteobacteria bacterium]|nr:MFS transporter [Alphaproteobacteria bacterium]
MAVNRASIVDEQFLSAVRALPSAPRRDDLDAPVRAGATLTARGALAIFESMVASRHLDLGARELKARDQGYYTIGSSGHECNAAVAAALRPTDPAFLHYRSGGFFVHRASQVPGQTPLLDVLLGIVAAADEPIAGGRHKVFGSLALQIPPQTSTIASHLPKAVGAAFALPRMKRLGLPLPIPGDSIVVCSFGDASSNHATASTAFNTAALADFQKLPCPIVFLCEDNGLGISVRTPGGWVEGRFRPNPGLKYFGCDGLDLVDSFDTAAAAAAFAREHRRPVFLHLRLVRLLGHAGSDVEQLYRSAEEIEAAEARDPVLAAARLLVAEGWLSPDEVLALYEETRTRVLALCDEVVTRPKLTGAAEIMAPLSPHRADAVAAEAARLPAADARTGFHGSRMPEQDRPRHLAMQLNRCLGDALLTWPEAVIFGEDVARKGGVYHVTADLQKKATVGRVFNTPLDETSILGLALGAGQLGMLPVPEIQYLAYLHNAVDQLRGEAGSLQFFSQGQFKNPMVVRIAGLAYQKGFGGHFHNDNGIAAVREIPGVVVACPSNGRDAVGMLRTLLAAARVDGQVSCFLEPIALYMTKDLYDDKDGRWSFTYPAPGWSLPLGEVGVWTPWAHDVDAEWSGEELPAPAEGGDLTVLSFANGLWMSLRVARRLAAEGHRVRVVDLRWLKPLPAEAILAEVDHSGRCLVVDECRDHSGIADEVVSLVARRRPGTPVDRIMASDTYIPLGAAANLVLLQEPDIEAAMRAMLSGGAA